ncbi:MAG: hypothetical protein JWN67_3664 [Actinomycetia bacterium]|nr:hypothetical protein [Actinomycetes bacterium]
MNEVGDPKGAVHDFWDAAACGEVYLEGDDLAGRFAEQERVRYELEPYIRPWCGFDGAGLDVLEIGVGLGADHLQWARSRPRRLVGLDLTERAVELTTQRLLLADFPADVRVGDAEHLPFDDASFDVVYSWGVLHHTPDTSRAFAEVARVLRPGGRAFVMVYHRWSIVGLLLWLRYALLAGRPLRSLDDVYARHLESPGTKAYSPAEVRAMLPSFRSCDVAVQLTFGDLLEGAAGQRHQGRVLALARRVLPRWLIRRHLGRLGLFLLVDARK